MKARYTRASDVLWRNVGSEALLARPDAESIEALSATAAAVWRLLESPATEAELSEELAGRYRKDLDVIHRDVHLLLEKLSAGGFVKEVKGAE
jgi:hypothetical protein